MPEAPKPPAAVTNEPFRNWIRSQPCFICTHVGIKQATHTECAHVRTRRNNGDFANLLPFCTTHHQRQHRMGIVGFSRMYEVDMTQAGIDYQQKYIQLTEPFGGF